MRSDDVYFKTLGGVRRAVTAPPAFVVEGAVEVVKLPDPVVVVNVPRIELDDPVLELAELVFVVQPGGALPKLMLTTAATSSQLF